MMVVDQRITSINHRGTQTAEEGFLITNTTRSGMARIVGMVEWIKRIDQ